MIDFNPRPTLPHQTPARRGQYSLGRAIRQLARGDGRGVDGLEGEVHREFEIRYGVHRSGEFFIPWDCPVPVQTRALNVTTGAGAVATNTRAPLIDVLRAKALCGMLGAQYLTDFVRGETAYPRKSAAVTLGWFGDGGAPSAEDTANADSQALFTAHHTAAFADFTRAALRTIDTDALVIGDLLGAAATELDRVGLAGSGSNNEPTGILYDSDVTTYPLGTNGAALTRADAIAIEQALGEANADVGRLAWVTTPAARAKLRGTEVGTDSGRFLWSDADTILSAPAFATNQLPSDLTKGSGTNLSALIFGNFEDLMIGMWGPPAILVNPFKFAASGYVRVHMYLSADIQLKHAESFQVVKDVVTS